MSRDGYTYPILRSGDATMHVDRRDPTREAQRAKARRYLLREGYADIAAMLGLIEPPGPR